MEILISETSIIDADGNNIKGYSVSVSNRAGKRSIQDADVFLNGSEIETKIQQLRKLLKKYFDAQV
jgi:hypothetical protein